MCVTATPTSSMCPKSASVEAPPAATRAKELPRLSECTSANFDAASRQTAATGSS